MADHCSVIVHEAVVAFACRASPRAARFGKSLNHDTTCCKCSAEEATRTAFT